MKHEIRVLEELGLQFERLATAPKQRRWSWAWRWRPLGLVFAGVLVASAVAAAALVGQRSAAPTATLPVPVGSKPNAADARRYDIAFTPNLNGGAVGWCLLAQLAYSGGGEGVNGTCGAPLKERPIITFSSGESYISASRYGGGTGTNTTTIAAVTTPQVAAVRISPKLTILTRSDPALPNGYRIAVVIHETTNDNGGKNVGTVLTPPFTWVALAGDGHVIPTSLRRPSIARLHAQLSPHDSATYWQTGPTHGVGPQPKLHTAPAGACEIDGSALAGARPSFGEVVEHVHGFPNLAAKTYLSCAYTWLSYHGYGMQAAILLDAQHPGSAPAPLPDAKVVSRNPTVVNEPAGISNGTSNFITARRLGDAWFLVESSSTLAARLAALHTLSACVSLTPTPCAAPQ
jgi:hypothetical protein